MLAKMQLPAGDTELTQIMDAALAKTARLAGAWLVCHPGCTQCCHGAFAISPLDALRLRAGLKALRAEKPELAEAVELRARAWVAEHGTEFPGNDGLLGESDEQRERFEEFANEAACPALNPISGRCDLYASRPMTCRVFGPPVRIEAEDGVALAHCELCFVGASTDEVAACAMQPPHELEVRLTEKLGAKGETVVAFALTCGEADGLRLGPRQK
jgi:Fe-S-cluster containining protein